MAPNKDVKGLRCLKCDQTYPLGQYFEGCPSCRTEKSVSNLTVEYDYSAIKEKLNKGVFSSRCESLWRYWDLLPVDPDNAVTLGEGMTPLIECDRLGKELNISALFLKDESRNPTWSFKDRLCSVAVTHAKEINAPAVTISSTGNHGASTAAYAARAGLPCIVFTVESVPKTMKTLMQSYGAKVVACKTYSDRWTLMHECIKRFGWYPTSSYVSPPVGSNYFGIEGYKSIAYEIIESLSWEIPDVVVIPAAYGDGLTGIWKGFKEFKELGFINRLPKLVAVEPFGPLANALNKGINYVEEVPVFASVAFSIGANISTYQGLQALKESQGTAVTVQDDEIIKMQQQLGSTEGMYAEMSSVASLVGACKLRKSNWIEPDDKVVCFLTSTGLKDPATTAAHMPEVPFVNADIIELKGALKKYYNFPLD